MKNKRIGIRAMTFLLMFSMLIWSPVGIHASGMESRTVQMEPNLQDNGSNKQHRIEMSKEQFEAYRMKKLQEMATYFDISTEGKTADQLKQELKVAKEANAEKWEAFKEEHREARLEHLQRFAKEHGIETEGKTEAQLLKELRKEHANKDKKHGKDGTKGETDKKGKRQERMEESASPVPAPSPAVNPAPSISPKSTPSKKK